MHTHPRKPDAFDQINLILDDKLATSTTVDFKPSKNMIYFFEDNENEDNKNAATDWKDDLSDPQTISQLKDSIARCSN